MAFIQDQQARRRRNYPRLLHRVAAGRDNRFALCLTGYRTASCRTSSATCKRARNQLPGAVRRLHSAAAIARYHLCRYRTGIAPLAPCCIGCWPIQPDIKTRVWLLFGNRTEQDIYYHQEFLGLAGQHSNFNYLPTLSRGASEWPGLRGYVQEHLPGIVQNRTDMHAYMCAWRR